MQQERLTPPSPTETTIREVRRLASVYAASFESERARGITQTLDWILGEGPRPNFPETDPDAEN